MTGMARLSSILRSGPVQFEIQDWGRQVVLFCLFFVTLCHAGVSESASAEQAKQVLYTGVTVLDWRRVRCKKETSVVLACSDFTH